MLDNTARMIGTVGVWTSFAIVMTFGVCRMNWSGDNIFFPFMLTIAMICASAVAATAFIWRSQPVAALRAERGEPAAG
jgi:hypothetical protein